MKWRKHVHGVSVRQFMIQGHQMANLRLDRLLEDQRRLLHMHEAILDQPTKSLSGYDRTVATAKRIAEQIRDLEREIADNEAIIRELDGAPPPNFRLPNGSIKEGHLPPAAQLPTHCRLSLFGACVPPQVRRTPLVRLP